MTGQIKWYLDNLTTVLLRPIYFYVKMEKGPVQDRSFSFVLGSGWLLAFLAAFGGYSIAIWPMLTGLVGGLPAVKKLIVGFPFVVLSLMFFVIILLVAAAVSVAAITVFFYLAGMALDRICVLLGGKASAEMIKACFYSSAVVSFLAVDIVWLIMAKYGLLSFQNFLIGTNILLSVIIFYLWGLWSIAVRRIYGFSKQKSLSATSFALLIMLLLQLIGAIKILPVLGRWIV